MSQHYADQMTPLIRIIVPLPYQPMITTNLPILYPSITSQFMSLFEALYTQKIGTKEHRFPPLISTIQHPLHRLTYLIFDFLPYNYNSTFWNCIQSFLPAIKLGKGLWDIFSDVRLRMSLFIGEFVHLYNPKENKSRRQWTFQKIKTHWNSKSSDRRPNPYGEVNKLLRNKWSCSQILEFRCKLL